MKLVPPGRGPPRLGLHGRVRLALRPEAAAPSNQACPECGPATACQTRQGASLRAPLSTLFKSSEAKPSLSIRPVGLPPRAGICLLYTVLTWNARRVESTSVLLPNSSRLSLFTQAQFKLLCNSNVNGQWFKCKQISIYFCNPGFWQSLKRIGSILISGNILSMTFRVLWC